MQWVFAVEAIHVGMLVLYFCGYLLSDTKCDLKASKMQRYLGILRDSGTALLRIVEDRLRTLHALILAALGNGTLTAWMLEDIAGTCVSTSSAIYPASLCTHFEFAAIEKTKGRTIQLDNKPDLCVELKT